MAKKVKGGPVNERPASANKKTLEKNDPVGRRGTSPVLKLCIVLGILAFLVYANTLRNSYAGDDELFITSHSLVNKGIAGIPEILTSPRMKGVMANNNDTYRPVSQVMFAVEKEIFGFNPAPGHLINILLFSVCVILLFLVLDRLMEHKKTAVAFIAALIFAVHPVHTEVVANIKSRDELMCFLFAFWSLLSFITYYADGKNARLAVGFFTLFLSLLSRETSISFIIVIPLVFFFYLTGNRKRSITITVATVIAVALFLGIRVMVLGASTGESALSGSADNQLVIVPAGASGIATAILACGHYIKLLLIPYPLLCTYSFATIPFANFSDVWVWISLMIYLVLAVAGCYRLVKFKRDPWAFGILFYLITIALFTNVLFLVPALFAERFMFFASAGFCLLIALLVEKYFFGKKGQEGAAGIKSGLLKTKVLLLLAAVVFVFSGMTISRNKDWENDYILHKTDVEKAPENARLYRNLGWILLNNLNNENLRPDVKGNMIKKGADYFRKALAVDPDLADAHAGLGQLYVKTGMFDSAEAHGKRAMALDPMNIFAVDNLGLTYFFTNRFSEAIAVYTRAIQMHPGLVTKYSSIGTCYQGMHKHDSAIVYFKKALDATPQNSGALYAAIARSFREMGKADSAKKYELLMRQ